MAAPRTSSFKVLRNLQKASSSIPAKRSLHITGVHASPAALDPGHKNAYLPLSLQDLRNECRKRSLMPTGTRHELIDRLAGHDNLQARAFSIAMKRIASEQTRQPLASRSPAESVPQREFNTSRELKARGDTSTIDFAYLPKLFEDAWGPQPAAIRVPILPDVDSDTAEAILEKHPELDAAAGGYQDTPGLEHIMKPQISSIEESAASPMSDVHDGHHATEMSVDMLTELTETVGKSARKFLGPSANNEHGGSATMRRLWNDFLDDLLGPSKK